jgi:hypothetical protein
MQPDEYDLDTKTLQLSFVRKVYEGIRKYGLSVSKVTEIIKSHCSNGHTDYNQCGCTKSLDEEVAEEVEKASILGLFLTNRPA